MYPRALLFRLPPETAHAVGMAGLELLSRLRPGGPLPGRPVRALGLTFANPVGLAAGLDKNADHVDALGSLGFGFIEVGTVTPRPQPGNPRPRLFRLPQARAIINRMGFNNLGVGHLVERIRRRRYPGVLGVNIGKNFDTPIEDAAGDYLAGLRAVYPLADYVVVNVSSPNTRNLRSLQEGDSMARLLECLLEARRGLEVAHGRRVPLLVKIAPDLTDGEVGALAGVFRTAGIDGVIATNTTLERGAVQGQPHAGEAGGLSGAPLAGRARQVLQGLVAALSGSGLVVIASGGIMSAADACERLEDGASLVQLYSGLIYAGPGLVADAVRSSAAVGDIPRTRGR